MRTALILTLPLLFSCRNASTEAAAAPAAKQAVSAPAAPIADACSLVPRPEVESIFGSLKGDPKSGTGLRNERECRYQNLDGQWLETSVFSADRWDLEKGIVSEMHPTSIPSLGDDAFSVKQGTDSVVYIRKGASMLEVSCSCDMQKTKTIASKVIGKV